MKLPRPHIPITVRIAVAARQCVATGKLREVLQASLMKRPTDQLAHLLWALFKGEPCHVDHDPPLMLRQRTRDGTDYVPRANDPEHLVYRTAENHRIKTFVRGDGAQLPDVGKRRKEIRRQRKKTRPRYHWPQGRKLRGRPFERRTTT